MLHQPNSDLMLLDCELVRCAQEGNQDCFRTLIEHHDAQLHRLVRERVIDEAIVEELCQEIRLRAWQKLSTVRQPYFFRRWYYKLAINYVTGWLRDHRRPHEPLEDETLDALISP
jgi:RNA polymerase sigma-70 factor (ECF subfamily)